RADRSAFSSTGDRADNRAQRGSAADKLSGSLVCPDAVPLSSGNTTGIRRDGISLPVYRNRFQIEHQLFIRGLPHDQLGSGSSWDSDRAVGVPHVLVDGAGEYPAIAAL